MNKLLLANLVNKLQTPAKAVTSLFVLALLSLSFIQDTKAQCTTPTPVIDSTSYFSGCADGSQNNRLVLYMNPTYVDTDFSNVFLISPDFAFPISRDSDSIVFENIIVSGGSEAVLFDPSDNSCSTTTLIAGEFLPPTAINIDESSVAVTNNTVCSAPFDGAIDMTGTVSGGNDSDGYEYSLDGGPFQSSPIFSNLENGDYTVTVQDGNGCTLASDPITVGDNTNRPVPTVNPNPAEVCVNTSQLLDAAISGGSGGLIYEWSGDTAPLDDPTIEDPTFTTATDGTYNLELKVTDGTGCADSVDVVVNVQPQLVVSDQTPAVCEDAFGSGNSTQDLTALENSINSDAGVSFTWYVDAGLTTTVPDPTNVTVTDADDFFAAVTNGVCTNTASVTYTVNPQPAAADQTPPPLCEDTEGSGTVAGIDLTTLENGINSGAGLIFTWYEDAGLTTTVADPTNVTVADADDFFVEVSDGTCTNVATVTYTVNPLPAAADQSPAVCEDAFGSGNATVDLTALENGINSGAGLTFTWYEDAGLTTAVADPTNVTVADTDDFFVEVDDGTCTNVASVTYTVNPLPAAADQTPAVCEDAFGSGSATVDLTALEASVNGGAGLTFTWYENAGLTTTVADPTAATTTNGEDFYAEVSDGTCSNVAAVTYTVDPLPAVADQTPAPLCEDTQGGGTVAGIDLTALEASVNGGGGLTFTWYEDAGLTTAVADPTNVTVADADDFFVEVSDGTCSNVASVTYSVDAQPVVVDQTPELCEDAFGSGTVAGVDLSALENSINSDAGVTFTWYENAGLTTIVADPTNVTVADADDFFVEVENGACTEVATVTYTVNPLPAAADQLPAVCEDAFGSGNATVDLTALQASINGGGGLTFTWYEDAGLTTTVADPTAATTTDGEDFYAEVSDGTCSNVATVTYTVDPLQAAADQTPELCEDTFGGGTVAGVDLTALEASVNGGGGLTFTWYEDAGLTTAVADPTNVTVADADDFFVEVSDGTCSNVATVTYTVNPLPAATDQSPAVCEDAFGSGNATVDLTALENGINSGAGLTFTWYEDAGLTSAVADPNVATTTDGEDFYAEVSEGTCTNVATITYTVDPLPAAADQTPAPLCEDTEGSGTVAGIDLTALENGINSGAGLTFTWYEDAGLTTTVTDPTAATTTDGEDFYAEVSDGTCSNVATVTYTVDPLPAAADQTPELCEDTFGGGTVAGVDLTALEASVNGGGGLTFTWYEDAGLTTAVADPTNVTVADADDFFVEVDDGTCTNVASVTYTVNPLPAATDQSPAVCEDAFGSGNTTVNLTALENGINSGAGLTFTWYEDAGLTSAVADPTSVSVTNTDDFYAEVSDGTCTNVATVTYTVDPLPAAADQTPAPLCEDTEGSGTVAGIDLTALENGINSGAGLTFTWYEDAGLTSTVADPTNVTVADADDFFVEVSDGTCSNVATVTYTVNPLPAAAGQTPELCEDTFGGGTVSGVDLTALEASVNGGGGLTFTWFEDAGLTTAVADPTNVTVANADDFFVEVDNGTCTNVASVTYTVNPLDDAGFSYPATSYCEDEGIASPDVINTPGGTFSAVQPGVVINSGTGAIDLAATGSGNYDIIYTTSGTCTNADTISMNINPLPVTTLGGVNSPAFDNDPPLNLTYGPTGGTLSTTASAGLTDNGDGTATFNPALATAGTYDITYSFTNGNGCTDDTTATIVVQPFTPDLTADFTASDDTVCVGSTVTYTNQTVNATGSATYTWDFGADASPATATGEGPHVVSYSSSGDKTVSLEVNDASATPTSDTETKVDFVFVRPDDDATFSYSQAAYCQDESNPVPTISGDAGGTFSSQPGIVLDAATGEIDLLSSTTGSYDITYTTAGNCPASSLFSVTLNDTTDASFNYPQSAYCENGADPSPVISGDPGGTFSASPAGLNIDTNTGEIDLSASSINTYRIFYTTGGVCSATDSFDITIEPLPDAGTDNTLEVCNSNSTVDLFAALGGAPDAGGVFEDNDATGALSGSTFDASLVTPGAYAFSYIVSGTACNNDTATVTVNVNAPPNAGADNVITICESNTTFDLSTLISGGDAGGNFEDVDGSSGLSGSTLDASVAGPGTFDYHYIVSGTACDNDTAGFTVTIEQLPDAGTNNTITVCNDNDAVDLFAALGGTPEGGGTFTDNDATGALTGSTFDATLVTPGSYDFTYTVTGTVCSDSSATVTVAVDPQDDPSFSYVSSSFCQNDGTVSPNTIATPGGTFSAIQAGISITTQGLIDLDNTAAGTYDIVYVTSGTCSASDTVQLTINTIPTVTLGGVTSPVFDNDPPLNLTYSPTGGALTTSASAGLTDNGDGTATFDPAVATAGTYDITYSFTNGNGCSDDTTATIVVQAFTPNLTADFTASSTDVCAGETVTYTDQTVNATGSATYSWNFGSGASPATATGIGPHDVTYGTSGSKTVSLEVNDASATPTSDTETKTDYVTVRPPDDATFSYSQGAFCVNEGATYTPTTVVPGTFSAPGGLAIDPSTGAIDPSASIPGSYLVTYTTSGACPNTSSRNININTADDASFSYGAVTFCASDGIISPLSMASPGGTFNAVQPGVVIAANGALDLGATGAGSYDIIYTTNGFCPSSDTVTITVNAAPAVSISGVTSPLCGSDAAITLTGNNAPDGAFSSTASGFVDFGDGTARFDPSQAGPGTYTVSYTYNDGTCSNTATETIVVNDCSPGVAANFLLSDTEICVGEPLTITDASSSAVNYSWDFGADASPATDNTDTPPAITYSSAGVKTIELTVDDGGTSSDVFTANVTVTAQPVADAGADFAACNLTANLGAVPSVGSGTWSVVTGSGSFSDPADPNAVFTADNAGTYELQWTETNGGCVDSDTVEIDFANQISISPVFNPDPNSSLSTNFCNDDAAYIYSSSSIDGVGASFDYEWSDGEAHSGQPDLYIFNAFADTPGDGNGGIRTVTITNPDNGCTGQDIVYVPHSAAEADLQPELEVIQTPACASDSTTLELSVTNSGGGSYDFEVHYIRELGIGQIDTIAISTLSGTGATTVQDTVKVPRGYYYVDINNLNSSDNCKKAGVTIDLLNAITPAPLTLDFLDVTNPTCPGDANGSIEAVANGGTGSLNFSLDGSPLQSSGEFTGLAVGTYVLAVEDNNGCVADTSITINNPASISAPNVLAESGLSCDQVTLNWNAEYLANEYFVELATDAGFTTGLQTAVTGLDTTATFSGLTDNTGYFYRITARGSCDTVTTVNQAFNTDNLPDVPTGIEDTAVTCTGLRVIWDATPDASLYRVTIDDNNDFGSPLAGYDSLLVADTLVDITGLVANTRYYVQLAAANGCGFGSVATDSVSTPQTPVAPVAINATNRGCDSLSVSWSNEPFAINYFVEISTDASFSSVADDATVAPDGSGTTSVTFNSLPDSTIFFFRVQSLGTCLNAGFTSGSDSTQNFPDLVENVTDTLLACDSLEISWDAITDATGYQVQIDEDMSFGSPEFNATVAATDTVFTGLNPAQTYYYSITAENSCGAGPVALDSTDAILPPATPVVTLDPLNPVGCDSLGIIWNTDTLASEFIAELATDAGFTSLVASTTLPPSDTSVVFTGLNDDTSFFYRITAVGSCDSVSSATGTATTDNFPDMPVVSFDSIACDSVQLSWNPIKDVTNYLVRFDTLNDFSTAFTATLSSTDSSLTVTNLDVPGLGIDDSVFVEVVATNGCGNSMPGTAENVMPVFSACETCILVAEATDANVTCTGDNDGRVQVNIFNGVGPFFYSLDAGVTVDSLAFIGGNLYVIDSLAQGNYEITVIDSATLCTDTTTSEVGIATQLQIATLDRTNIECGNPGEIRATISGGSGDYSYTWLDPDNNPVNPANVTDSLVVNLLDTGNYTLQVQDNINGCTEGFSIRITESIDANPVTVDITDVSCDGGDGEAVAMVNCGDANNYEFAWVNAANDTLATSENTNSNLAIGSYELRYRYVPTGQRDTVTFNVADGCTGGGVEDSCAIDNVRFITETTNVSCEGLADGTAALVMISRVDASADRFRYSIDSTQWQPAYNGNGLDTVFFASNLSDSTYNLYVWDSLAAPTCTDSVRVFPVTIGTDAPFTITTIAESCDGEDGTATFNACDTTGYSFVWEQIVDATTVEIIDSLQNLSVDSLTAGDYQLRYANADSSRLDTLEFTIADGCTLAGCGLDSVTFTVSAINATCPGGFDGALQVNIFSRTDIDTRRFQYRRIMGTDTTRWEQGGQAPLGFAYTNLMTGDYQIQIRDSLAGTGCDPLTFSRTISAQNSFSVLAQPETCDTFDGQAEVSLPDNCGEADDYVFIWSDEEGNPLDGNDRMRDDLTAGSYNVLVFNRSLDFLDSLQFNIGNVCNDGGGSNDGCNLGTRSVVVETTPTECDGLGGSVTLSVVGGNPTSYRYNIQGISNVVSRDTLSSENITFTDLPEGEYLYTVIDAVGRPSCTDTFNIRQNAVVIADADFNLPDCTSTDQTATLDVQIDASSTTAIGPYMIQLVLNGDTVTQQPIEAIQARETLEGLTPGAVYEVIVSSTDPEACDASTTVAIPEADFKAIDFRATTENIVCFGDGGQIIIDNLNTIDNTSFTFSVFSMDQGGNETALGATQTFETAPLSSFVLRENLGAGIYRIQLEQEQVDCDGQITTINQMVTITGPDVALTADVPPVVTTEATSTSRGVSLNPEGSITVSNIRGGGEPYEVALLDGPVVTDYIEVTNDNPFFDPFEYTFDSLVVSNASTRSSIYTVAVRDTFGCVQTYEVELKFTEDIFIPNVITPNGDQKNDEFQIINHDPVEDPNARMTITNRWGNIVFETDSYQNNWQGEDVPDGVYYYRFITGSGNEYSGWIEKWSGRPD